MDRSLPAELVDVVVRMRPMPQWLLVCRATRAMVERATGLYAFMRRPSEPADVPEYRTIPPTEWQELGADAREKERARVREARAVVGEFRDAIVALLTGPDPRAAVECAVRPALAHLVAAQDRRVARWAKQQERRIALASAPEATGLATSYLKWKEMRAPQVLHPLHRLRQLLAQCFGRANAADPEEVLGLMPLRPVPPWRIRRRRGDDDGASCGTPGPCRVSLEAHSRIRPGFVRTKVEIAFLRGLAETGRWDAVVARLAASPALTDALHGARCTCGYLSFFAAPSPRPRARLLRVLVETVRSRAEGSPADAFARVTDGMIGFRFGLCDAAGTFSCDLDAVYFGGRIGRAIARWAVRRTSGALARREIERLARALEEWLRTCRYADRHSTARIGDGRTHRSLADHERRSAVLAFWTECARSTARVAGEPETVGLCCGRAGALLRTEPECVLWGCRRFSSLMWCAAAFLVTAPSPQRVEEALQAAGEACDLANEFFPGDPLVGLFVPDGFERGPADVSAEAAERAVAWACARWSPDAGGTARIATAVPSGSCADAWEARSDPELLMAECAADPTRMSDRDRVERLIKRCADRPPQWWRDRVVRPMCAFLRSVSDPESWLLPQLGPVGCCLRLLRPDLLSRGTREADLCCELGCPICAERARPSLPDRKPGDPVSFAFGLPGDEVCGIAEIEPDLHADYRD